jgi:hypothetical protein
MNEDEYLLALQRSLLALIKLAKAHSLEDRAVVEIVGQAEELIRCRVLDCGNAGACTGVGTDQYPCPLRGER